MVGDIKRLGGWVNNTWDGVNRTLIHGMGSHSLYDGTGASTRHHSTAPYNSIGNQCMGMNERVINPTR